MKYQEGGQILNDTDVKTSDENIESLKLVKINVECGSILLQVCQHNMVADFLDLQMALLCSHFKCMFSYAEQWTTFDYEEAKDEYANECVTHQILLVNIMEQNVSGILKKI